MKKCGKQCPSCPFIKEGKFVKVNQSKWIINTEATCGTKNIVYLIECTKEQCKEKYIGETHRSLKEQTQEHISYVKSIFPTKSTGVHFNLPGHTLSNMTVTILEKVKGDELYRKERETILIRKFNTYHRGLNRQP